LRLQTQTVNMAPGAGNRNYSRAELFNMLALIHEILPIGGEDWNAVLEAHSVDFPGREVDSLRRKFSLLHRKKTPTGDPRCPEEVKLAKRIKCQISGRADVGDGEEEMDLTTGLFTNVVTEDGIFDGAEDGAEDEGQFEAGLLEDNVLEDEVPGEFDTPNVPGDDLLLLQRRNALAPTQYYTQLRTQETPALAASLAASLPTSAAARAPPALAASLAASVAERRSASSRSASEASPPSADGRSASSRSASLASLSASARVRAVARSPPPAAGAASMGSNAPRPLVAPSGDRTRGSRNNPQQDGLMQMMQMSMLQHNQQMEEDRQRRGEEREARLAMQQMLATAVGGAFAAFNKYTNNKDKDDDDE
jgi:hypothetical protein